MTDTLPSRNEPRGFFGTMQMAGADPMPAWSAASTLIAAETGGAPEAARDFLDSRLCRHFADDVLSGMANGGELEEPPPRRSSAGRAGGSTAGPYREEGIPAGLPFLTGWVAHFGILAETGT